ncbi:MAG TPA: YcaO-like family protein [Ktedonobacteraceae bacterium]
MEEPLSLVYQTLISPYTGLIIKTGEMKDTITSNPLRLCYAQVNVRSRIQGKVEMGWYEGSGAGITWQEAMMAAIGETVERYAATIYDDERDIIWATYNEVKEKAISPLQFALPSSLDFARFPEYFKPFDPDEKLDWASGWSIPEGTDVLVPASFVYAMLHQRTPSMSLSPNISTGLAAGSGPRAALLGGLCECIERDAFMITYLNRLPVPEIDLEMVEEPAIQDILQRIRPWNDCQIRAWNMTTDIGVASLLVVMRGTQVSLPAIICGAATHVDPVQALRKALIEAWQGYVWLSNQASLSEDLRQHTFAPDFSDVLTRDAHLALACQQTYVQYIDWLLAERPKISLGDLPDLSDGSLDQQLSRVLAEVNKVGLHVVACDLTPYEAQQAGLSVCRVLVPGIQQLTFGPVIVKSERLYEVPRRLGYTAERTTEASLNPIPHPFP